MKWIRWFREWRRVDRELKAEIEEHLREKTEELVESGMTRDEARARAQRDLGNVTRLVEASREAWGFTWLDELIQDLRFGARMLRRSPVLASIAILSLALGIGSTTAIFSLVDSIILRTLPVTHPDDLVIVRALTRQGTRDFFSHTDYEWLNEHNEVFTGLAASSRWGFARRLGNRTETVNGELVSGNYFSVLGVEALLGRVIRPRDDMRPGGQPVVVISYPYWLRAFGGNPNVVGQLIRFGETALEVVGVAPMGFTGEYIGYSADLWVPLSLQPALNADNSFLQTRNVSWLQAMGRLRPGVTIDQARASMSVLLDHLRAALRVDPQSDYLGSIGITPGGGGLSALREQYARPLWILMALVVLVLAIACANVANLLLARSTTRRREFGLRLALGAGRSRLVRQLLVEAGLLAGIACALGVAIAHGLIRALLTISQVDTVDVRVDLKVLAFAVAVSCAAALAFGLAPAIQSRRVVPWPTLKLGTRALAGAGRSNPLQLLVAMQAALSFLLLIGAGLLLRTFVNLKTLDPGFDEEQVLQLRIDAPDGGGVALGQTLVERLSQVAGHCLRGGARLHRRRRRKVSSGSDHQRNDGALLLS
jgi:predicted permease